MNFILFFFFFLKKKSKKKTLKYIYKKKKKDFMFQFSGITMQISLMFIVRCFNIYPERYTQTSWRKHLFSILFFFFFIKNQNYANNPSIQSSWFTLDCSKIWWNECRQILEWYCRYHCTVRYITSLWLFLTFSWCFRTYLKTNRVAIVCSARSGETKEKGTTNR